MNKSEAVKERPGQNGPGLPTNSGDSQLWMCWAVKGVSAETLEGRRTAI